MVLLTKIPGMKVFAPSSYQELQQMLQDAFEYDDGPCAIRWAKTAAPHVDWSEVGSGLSARCVSSSENNDSQVCILGAGKMLSVAIDASKRLASEGISSTVWDPRLISPLDQDMIKNAAEHSLVITIEDGFRQGGFGSLVRDTLAGLSPDTRISVLGVPVDHHQHGNADALLASFGLDGEGVASTIRQILN